jgi:YHS domain-containing protein
MAIDPVCHMEVDEKTAQWKSEYQGKMYYFCAPGCKSSFDKDPKKYLGQTPNQGEHEHHHHA